MCKKPNSVLIKPVKPSPTFDHHYGDKVDACMADFLQQLADEGFITVFSCCGHGEYGPYLTMMFNTLSAHTEVQAMVARLESQNWKDVYWVKGMSYRSYGMEEFSFYGEWNRAVPSNVKRRKINGRS